MWRWWRCCWWWRWWWWWCWWWRWLWLFAENGAACSPEEGVDGRYWFAQLAEDWTVWWWWCWWSSMITDNSNDRHHLHNWSISKRGRVQFTKKNRVECVQKPASSLQLDWKALSSKAVKITEVKGNEPAAMYWFPKAARIGGMTLQPTLNTTCLGREKRQRQRFFFLLP